jgi:Protein of unknown function (DUF732)
VSAKGIIIRPHKGDTMTHTNVGLGKWSTFSAALLSAAALVFVAPASADQTDGAFIAALQNQGIAIPDSNAAIQMGRTMCALLDQGTTRPLLLMKLVRDMNLSARQAGFFLGLSASAYCPQYKTVTDNSG